jgi:hypothetical protein
VRITDIPKDKGAQKPWRFFLPLALSGCSWIQKGGNHATRIRSPQAADATEALALLAEQAPEVMPLAAQT